MRVTDQKRETDCMWVYVKLVCEKRNKLYVKSQSEEIMEATRFAIVLFFINSTKDFLIGKQNL